MNYKKLLLFLILSLGFFVRFYNFDQRVLYGPEQGISLLSAAQNLDKPSLLGIPYLLRQTGGGLRVFTSPIFGYTLIPFILAFSFDPIKITAVFAILNLLTGFAVYLLAKKMFNEKVALFSISIFLFSDYMIYHSLFIWTSNYMPLVGLLTFFAYYKFRKERDKNLWPFVLGFLIGIGVGIQYFYLVVGFLVYLLIVKFSKKKFTNSLLFVFGGVVGELPTIIFDLKHDFYHLRTISTYLFETLKSPGQGSITYYHFLFFWPIAAIFLGLFLSKLLRKNRNLAILLLTIFAGFNLTSSKISFRHPKGMPEGLFTGDILKAAEVVKNDSPKNFNVSVVGDFDNRGYVLRYPLQFIHKVPPLPVENYPDADSIYVLANTDYDFRNPDIWELRTFLPYDTSLVDNVGTGYAVFKLTK